MPIVRPAPAEPRFRGLFPDWTGPQPVRWYFAQELLEARAASQFPTNAEGPDEDVNIHLIHLLAAFVGGGADPRIRPGADPLLLPPDRALPRTVQADWYAVNGDHRLLHLGLMDRGDGLRRRRVPLGLGAGSARERDLAAGQTCYELAANLLEGIPAATARAAVLRKLAEHFSDYVHVLGVLAMRRWGLGASLGEGELAGLLRGLPEPAQAPRREPAATMDDLLDELAAWRAHPTSPREHALRAKAAALGVEPERLGLSAA